MRASTIVAFALALAPSVSSPATMAWRLFTIGDAAPAQFTLRDDGSIVARADGAVAFLYRPVADTAGAVLSWRWRVDRDIPAVPLDRPGDDRPLAVHVWFPDDTLFAAVRAGLAELAGLPPVGYALTYAWGGTAARGTVVANPHLDTGVIITLRPGGTATGTWFAESVDIAADFERAFGFVAPPPRFVAISADTDDTGGHSEGAVADLALAAP